MPYKIVKVGDKWQVINKDTKKVKGTHKTEESAKSQMKLLYAIEHGFKPTKKNK